MDDFANTGRAFAAAALMLLLTACQTTPRTGDEAYAYHLAQGTVFVVETAVRFPPETISVYIQHGEVMAWGDVTVERLHCQLLLERRRPEPYTIPAETRLLVTGAGRRDELVQRARPRLASLGLGSDLGNGGASYRIRRVYYDLYTEAAPAVRRLVCGQWMDPPSARYPTAGEVRRALSPALLLEPRW